MDRVVARYSSLFTLPSYRNIIILLCIQCIVTGVAAFLPLNLSQYGLFIGLFIGILLFSATLLGNYLTAHVLLRRDLILDLRRCSFLSLASNSILLVFVFIAALASASFNSPNIWFKAVSLGVFASLSLRCLVFYSISFVTPLKIFLSIILQPVSFLAPLLIVPLSSHGPQSYPFMYFFPAIFAAFLGVYVFISSLNTVGIEALGIPSIKMFKAFLANWTEDLEEPLEEVLEQLSEKREVKVSIIAFQNEKEMKAAIVVPSIHPGPFKNVGSSPIPSLIQRALEEKLGCVVSVPHGISGHELDLASQAQNDMVLNRILQASKFDIFRHHATPFLSLRKDDATAGCQIFGDCAFLTLTLSPETMEDLPLELNDIIIQEAKRGGLAWAVAVDAHNSIQGPFDPEKFIDPIKEAVAAVLEEVMSCELSRFEVGAAKLIPTDFGIKEGVGPGGISIVVVKVGDQKTAYVTIDGNNMVSGLREKILSSLKEIGVNGGEILTTDTHVVNAAVMAERGYHPVGEMIDHDRLIEHIKEAVTEALRNLEPAEVSWRQIGIQGVKVIGERRINNLCLMVDEAAKKAKKTSTLVFPALGILFTVLLAFL
jgi:putative membrane protein